MEEIALRKWKELKPGTTIFFVRSTQVFEYEIFEALKSEDCLLLMFYPTEQRKKLVRLYGIHHWLKTGAIQRKPPRTGTMAKRA